MKYSNLFAQWKKTFPNAIEKTIPPGQRIITQGDSTDQVMMIRSGVIRIVIYSDTGGEYLISFSGAPNTLGSMEAILGKPILCTVEAVTEVVLTQVSQQTFLKSYSEDVDLANALGYEMAKYLYQFNVRASMMALCPIKEVLLHYLYFHKSRRGCEVPVTRAEMAQYAGISEKTVIRVLKEWEEQGVISRGRNLILFTDEEKITELVSRAQRTV